MGFWQELGRRTNLYSAQDRMDYRLAALDAIEQSSAGWRPIATEPNDETQRLVSTDPSDPECARLVTRMDDGRHFDGDVIIEDMGIDPTHWHPVPVGGRAR